MKSVMSKLFSASIATIAVAWGVVAWAGTPGVSVPSTPDASGKIVIKGSDVAAYSNVTVRFVHTGMRPIDSVVQASGTGAFRVEFQPPIDGGYTVQVFDSTGKKIGHGNFGIVR